MRCSVISSSGQTLAMGQLFIETDAAGAARLSFRSDRGRIIAGGPIAADGDLTDASKELFRGFFKAWGMTGVTLTVQSNQTR